MGGRTVWGMEIRSAVAGAFATVAVAGLVFTAVAVSNAAEPGPVAVPSVAVVSDQPTVESQDPVEYVPEPVAAVVPEVAIEAPAAAAEPAPPVVREDPPMPPADIGADPGSPPETPLCELPPEGYVGILVNGRMPRADGQPCHGGSGYSDADGWHEGYWDLDGTWHPVTG